MRSLRRQLEIALLELVNRALHLGRHRRWLAAGAVVLAPAIAAVAVLSQGAAAHPGAAHPPTTPTAIVTEPTPSPTTTALDPAIFASAAKRAPAAPLLDRLPQVDLNGLSVAGIPRAALAAYVTGARLADREDTSCHLRWWLLAGIGLVESGHAHSGGSDRQGWNGIARPPIYGPELDGKHGFAAIQDTDHGVMDGDKKWDRAVGPMQFLPSTWRTWGGVSRGKPRDPQDIRAAALAAGRYLCAGSSDLSTPQGMATAVYSYNHSFDYVRLVLTVAAHYDGINPDALGVNRLPHDQKAKKSAKPSPTPTASTTATAAGRPSPSAAPSAKPSSASPTPSPTSSTPPLLPLPRPTHTIVGVG